MIEVHPKMDLGDARLVMERHELADAWITRRVATVLGGLEAELAAKDAAIQEYSALLITERVKVAALTADCQELERGRAEAEAVMMDAEAKLERLRAEVERLRNEKAMAEDAFEPRFELGEY
jgi:chromosome segregation ATPase